MKKLLITIAALIGFTCSAFAVNKLYKSKSKKYNALKEEVSYKSDWFTSISVSSIRLQEQKNMTEAFAWLEKTVKSLETSKKLDQ
ncbi:hypothetical protein [Sediminitomix flava]|uniref:Uncharacterized protein n=1 Tax=Sediminitomix flava TaxID=379075 RepID=A0A315ZT15_SEDFL|nr:hypothetical protein [Sediminitomix flava]PWJ37970.1 hypothetical protein BC781_108105 [Sediminitomix flava]